MKKIALCFYGLSEGLNDEKNSVVNIENCLDSIKKNIVNNCSFDIFFHTWKNSENQENYLINLYKPKSYCFEDKKIFINKKKIIIDNPTFYNSCNSRWLSQKNVIELKENYEISNNFSYDITFVTRFDCFYINNFNLSKLEIKDSLYLSDWEINTPYKDGMNALDDLWFFSNSRILNKFKTIYDNIDDYCYELGTCSAHSFVYNHMKKQKLDFILYKNHKHDHNISRRLI
jgi:hypothetical protein